MRVFFLPLFAGHFEKKLFATIKVPFFKMQPNFFSFSLLIPIKYISSITGGKKLSSHVFTISKTLGPSCGPTSSEAEVLGFTHQKKTPFLPAFSYLHSHLKNIFCYF